MLRVQEHHVQIAEQRIRMLGIDRSCRAEFFVCWRSRKTIDKAALIALPAGRNLVIAKIAFLEIHNQSPSESMELLFYKNLFAKYVPALACKWEHLKDTRNSYVLDRLRLGG